MTQSATSSYIWQSCVYVQKNVQESLAELWIIDKN